MVDDINGKRWLSVTLACKYACMSPKTIMKYIRQGEIYGTLKGGKWYIDRESIDAFFLEDNIKVKNILAQLR